MIIKHLYQTSSRPALYIIIYILLWVYILYYLEFSDFRVAGGGGSYVEETVYRRRSLLEKLYI